MLRLETLMLILAVSVLQTPRTVKGRYRHRGQGFSVVVPLGWRADLSSFRATDPLAGLLVVGSALERRRGKAG